MRNFLQRAAGPGIVALIGLSFDAAGFFGSNVLAYVMWAVAATWALFALWPTLKRWRPLTLAPADTQLSTPQQTKEVGAEQQKTSTENEELRAARERLTKPNKRLIRFGGKSESLR